jgi:hypothetical protein
VSTREVRAVDDEQITGNDGIIHDDEELVTHPNRVDTTILLCPLMQESLWVLGQERETEERTRWYRMAIFVFEVFSKPKGANEDEKKGQDEGARRYDRWYNGCK